MDNSPLNRLERILNDRLVGKMPAEGWISLAPSNNGPLQARFWDAFDFILSSAAYALDSCDARITSYEFTHDAVKGDSLTLNYVTGPKAADDPHVLKMLSRSKKGEGYVCFLPNVVRTFRDEDQVRYSQMSSPQPRNAPLPGVGDSADISRP